MTEQAFLEQIRANQGIIYKLVGLYAYDAEEKKDLYQEVLLQTWKSLDSFRGEAGYHTAATGNQKTGRNRQGDHLNAFGWI